VHDKKNGGDIHGKNHPDDIHVPLMLNGKRMRWGLEAHNNDEVDSK
jgi:hypothetical protein